MSEEPLVIEGAAYGPNSGLRGVLVWSALPLGFGLGIAVGVALSAGGSLVPWLPAWGQAGVFLAALVGGLAGAVVGFARFQTFVRSTYRVTLGPDEVAFGVEGAKVLHRVSWSDLRGYRVDRRGWVRLLLVQAHSAFLDLRVPCRDDSETAAVADLFEARGVRRA